MAKKSEVFGLPILTDVANLQANVAALQASYTTLQTDFTTLLTRYNNLVKDMTERDLVDRVATLETSVAQLKTEVEG